MHRVLRRRQVAGPAHRVAIGREARAGQARSEAGALPPNEAERAPAGLRRGARRDRVGDVWRAVVGRLHPAAQQQIREDGVVTRVVLRVLDAVGAVRVVHHHRLLRSPLDAASDPAALGSPCARREDADAERVTAHAALVAVGVVGLRAAAEQLAWGGPQALLRAGPRRPCPPGAPARHDGRRRARPRRGSGRSERCSRLRAAEAAHTLSHQAKRGLRGTQGVCVKPMPEL